MAFGDIAKETRNPKQSLSNEIYEILFSEKREKQNLKYNKKILICGENGTGKSTAALEVLCAGLKDDEIVIYIDVDNSGAEVISNYFEDLWFNDNIRYYNPFEEKKEIIKDKEVFVRDEEGIVNNTIAVSSAIRQALEEGIKVRGVIVDGVSFLLEYAEAKMRIDKNLDVDQGVNMLVWKVRNDFFKSFSLPYMSLPTTVIFISHDDFIQKDPEKELSNVKRKFIDECSIRLETYKESNANNSKVIDYYAVVKKDRSIPINLGRKVRFLSVNTDESLYDDVEEISYDDFGESYGEDLSNILFRSIQKPQKKSKKVKNK